MPGLEERILIDEIMPLLESGKRIYFICCGGEYGCGNDLKIYFHRNTIGDLVVEVERCESCIRDSHNEGFQYGKILGEENVLDKLKKYKEKEEMKKKKLFEQRSKNRKLDLE